MNGVRDPSRAQVPALRSTQGDPRVMPTCSLLLREPPSQPRLTPATPPEAPLLLELRGEVGGAQAGGTPVHPQSSV